MGEVNVTFVINVPSCPTSFSSWEDIKDTKIREDLEVALTDWEKKVRYAAILHLIKLEIGEEGANQVQISFTSENDKRA